MSKRVSNKKGRSRKTPARSMKTAARARQKIRIRKTQIAAKRRREEMLEEVQRRFGSLEV